MSDVTDLSNQVFARWVEEDKRFAFSSVNNGGVIITVKKHQELLNGESDGRGISADKLGMPVLVDLPAPSIDVVAAQARAWRDAEIESVKWLRERHRDEVDSGRPTTLSASQSGELLDYVQLLRDWPATTGFPSVESRPLKPDWLIQQVQ